MKPLATIVSLALLISCSNTQKHLPVVFDVPEIIKLNKSQIIQQLGTPASTETPGMSGKKGDDSQTLRFMKNGYELAVDVSILTGKVTRAFICWKNKASLSYNELANLNDAGNLDSLPFNFWDVPEDIHKNGQVLYTGIRIRTLAEEKLLIKDKETIQLK